MKTKTQFHKLTAWLLTLAMLMTFIPSFTLAASAAESLTDSTTGVILADSDGDDYYEVDTPDKLVAFANLVNAGNDSINIELTDDIDMTGKEWSMIVYGGTIDGNEHTVSNLTFVATEAEGEQYAGLIYAYDATVRNITFKNCRTVINSETSSGRDIYAAIIAPVAIGGIFENCSLVDSTVTQSGMASGCSYAGSLAGLTAYGLKITGCSVEGCTVTDDSESEDGNFAGGLAGGFWADEAAYDFGVQVKNNTINADVTAKNSPGVDAASGLICSVLDDSLAIVQVYDNCIVDGTIIADDVAAGLIGDCIGYDMTISNCTVLCDSISAAQGDPFAYGEWAQKGEHDYYTMTYSDLKISENTEFVCKQFENTLGKYYLSDLYADGAFDADIVSFADSAAEVSYAVTVSDSIENGTVVADVSEAAEGDTVTLTVTPADGYKLDTLTVKDADNGNVTVTDNKFTMPAKAVTVTATFKEVAIGHIHSICGEEHTEIGDHNSVGCAEVTYAAFPTATDSDTSDGITATVSDGKVAVTLVGGEESNPKTYNLYLNGDIALSKPLNIPAYTTLNLCLNGFALDASAASESIYQQVALLIGGTASTLNLCDCNGSYNIHKFTADDTGKWTMDESGNQEISGGVIIGGSVDNSGTFNMYGGSIVGASKRGVLNRYNSINSTFNMYAGEIVGNADGGVDCNYTEFTLYGGKIHNNVTVKNGAGILANYTTFNMYGGEIYKNTSTYEPETNKINGGGGVFFNGNASNVFTMTGGKIHNNSAARDGGGVLIQGAAFSLSGGEISENITAKKGGGVILDTFNTVSISGGSITGNKAEIGGGAYSIGGGDVQLSGRVKITDNTLADGSTASNLYLARTENILQLSVTGALENEAHIGVSMEIPDIFTTAGTYTVTNDDKTKFTSDSDAYEVELTDGVLSLQPMVPRVATPENPRWLYTSAAFWDAVDGATGYALKLYAGGTTEAHLVQRLSVGNEVSAYLYNILSGIVDDADLDSAEFYFSVRAKGNNYTTADSEWSEIIGPQTHVQPVPVLIVTQPTTQSVMVGSSATFSITAAGDSPITYQWQFSKDDGSTWENVVYNQTDSTLSGTTATYTVNNVTTDMNGWQYRCVATNMSGTKTATSEAVTLAVKEIFTVTFNANGGTCETTSAETVDGKLAELPTPTYDGYVFNGWFDAAEGGNKITISTVFDADTTIYAQWTQKIVITADMITVDEETYNGEQQLPNETIIVNGQPLVRNVDYSVQVWPDANYYRDAGEWEFFIHMDMNPVYIGEKIRMVQTIHKATPTYTAPTGLTAAYGDTLADIELPTGFTWQDDETTSVGNVGVNTFNVKFTPTDTDNYNVVENIPVEVNVSQATLNVSQTVSEANWYPKMDIGVSLYLKDFFTITKANGDAVTDGNFSFDVEVTDIQGSPVDKLQNAGTYTVKVVLNNHNQARYTLSQDTFTFTVKPLDLSSKSITVTAGKPTYTGQTELPTETSGGKLNFRVKIFNVFANKETSYTLHHKDGLWEFAAIDGKNNVNAGNAWVNVVGKTGNIVGAYEYEYTINKAQAAIDVDDTPIEITYGETLTLPTATTNFGTVSADKTAADMVNAGNYTVTYKVEGTDNFNGATKTVSVTINPKKIDKPSADDTSFVYNGNEQTYNVAENPLYTISGNKRTNAGSQTVTVALNDKVNYTWDDGSTDDVTFTFTIAKETPSYTVPTNLTATYGQTLADVSLPTGFAWQDANSTSVGNAGNNKFKVTYTLSDTNYNEVKDIEVTIAVAKATVTKPAADTTEFTYNGSEHTYTVAESSLYTVNGNKKTNAGEHTVTVVLADKANYIWADGTTEDATYPFVIAKANASITVDTTPIEKTYGETWDLPVATSTFGTPVADKTIDDMVNAGTYTITYSVAGTDNYNGDTETVSVTINPVKVTKPANDTTEFVYNGSEQTYAVAENDNYTVSGNKRTDAGEQGVTVSLDDKSNYTWADGTTEDLTFTFNIATLDITNAVITLGDALTYNGTEQTQTIASVKVDGLDVTYTVTDDKATNYNADGYELTVTANGNFSGTKTASWSIAKATPAPNAEKVTTARVRRGQKLANATVTNGEFFALDGTTILEGTFAWVDDTKEITADSTEKMKFTPTDTNYAEIEIDVAVDSYTTGGGGGSSSNTTTTTTKNEDGSTTKTTTNKATGTTTEVTTNTDGSTTTVETKKDGTVTTTEKDKDGNTTTTVENPDGTSTTTEKNKDGSETVVEKDAEGTTTTTEKDSEGNKTVTTEKADGTTTTEETKKDGTTVKTETNADGETTAQVEAKGETEVVIPVENADEVTKVVVTDKNGNETEVEFEVKDGGVAISVSGNSTVSVQTGHTCYAKDFTDVDLNAWYHLNIDYVLENGLFKGTTETTFAPNANLTRAMLVTVLYRAEGEPKVSGITSFADLEKGGYYLDAVCWAQVNGIVNGVSETEFAPNDNITREQIAAIMHRYAKYKGYDVSVGENTNILSYDDFDSISEYAIGSMQWAVGSALIKGKSESTLNPLDNATRAEVAAILHRFIVANK